MNTSGDLQTQTDYLELKRLVDEKTGKQKTAISVAQVRELNTRLGLTSMAGGWKVVFIENVSYLSKGGANALLKTLEEPKGKTLFILTAHSIDELPETIVSRCQTLLFSPIPREEIKTGLVKMGFSPVDASLAATQSLGRPGRAIRFLKESTYRSQQDTGLEQALLFFSSGLAQRMGQVTDLIPKSEIEKTNVLLNALDQWEVICRDVLFARLGLQELRVLPKTMKMDALVSKFSEDSLLAVFERMAEVRVAVRHNINAHLALEHIALAI